MIGVKRGKMCASESRLVGFTPGLTKKKLAQNVSVQNRKLRNTQPKRIRITFDIQVKTTLASPFYTEQQRR